LLHYCGNPVRRGIEALSRDTSFPRLAVSRICNRTFVSCCIMNDTTYLYDALGRRLYLTPGERDAFLRTALGHDRPVRTFCSLLYYTGCRISEALHWPPRKVMGQQPPGTTGPRHIGKGIEDFALRVFLWLSARLGAWHIGFD
jgi:hypothetical protein